MDRLFEFQTVQSHSLKTLFEVLKDVLTDVNIIFDQTGIKIMAMDGNHVALIHLKLEAENFEYFYCKQKTMIGVCMMSIHKLMKTISNSDTVTMYMDTTNTDLLHISIRNSEKNSITNFSLKLLDIDEEELEIPDVEIDCIITMNANEFQKLCRDMINIKDVIRITSEKDKISFACEGDFAKWETVIGETSHGLCFNKQTDDYISAEYSLKYINLFTKSTNLCNTIELYLKPNYPLIMKYNVGNLGEIRFCLAAKAQTD
jgi:proliferating cell nuclear antigen